MKRTTIVAAVAGILATGTTASAAILMGYNGPVTIKLSNYDTGTQYHITQDATYVGETVLDSLLQTPSPGALAGEDAWTIMVVQQILAGQDGSGAILYERGSASTEITAIIWGTRDTYLKVTNAGTALEVQDIHSVGLHAAFFEDLAKNYSGTAGPSARDNSDPNKPWYPTVTDGTPLWTMNSAPGFNSLFPSDEFFTTYSPSGNLLGGLAAAGGFYADFGAVPGYGTGPDNGQWASPANQPDLSVQFTGRLGSFNWLVNSEDPVLGTMVPEPGSAMIMAGLGLLGLARRRARR
jgi:hypothetical protein